MDRSIEGVSVILCCYNSANRIKKTLEYLARQEVSISLKWEIILVNNNSTDSTVLISKNTWNNLGAPSPMLVVDETQPGLSFAREKGMSAAQYDIFLFCDDDNWLHKNYIQRVHDIFNKHPEFGALGGWCEAVFEKEEPDWFTDFAGNFAVGRPKENSGILDTANSFLYGAGLAMSRKAKLSLNENGFANILSDRKGKQLSSGGDVEIIYALKLMGFSVYFDEQLYFNHFMPSQRLTWEYLIKLRKSMYWSNFVLGIYVDAQKNVPYDIKAIFRKIVNNIKYILKHKRRLQKLNESDALFLKNQINTRKLFLKNINFYIKTRKRLDQLING